MECASCGTNQLPHTPTTCFQCQMPLCARCTISSSMAQCLACSQQNVSYALGWAMEALAPLAPAVKCPICLHWLPHGDTCNWCKHNWRIRKVNVFGCTRRGCGDNKMVLCCIPECTMLVCLKCSKQRKCGEPQCMLHFQQNACAFCGAACPVRRTETRARYKTGPRDSLRSPDGRGIGVRALRIKGLEGPGRLTPPGTANR